METINIQFQVPSTGQYTLDEFVAKLKDYAEKLASSISKSGNSYQETYMSQAEQEAYVAESLNRALDELEAHKKNGTKPMDARDLLTIYDKGEISNISDEFISFLLDKRKNG